MGLTYRSLLHELSRQLSPVETGAERQVAVDILAAYLQERPENLWQNSFESLSQAVEERFWQWFWPLFEQRKKGRPWAYLLGETYFMGYRFLVHPSVLIPRSDSEIIVEESLEVVRRIVEQKRTAQKNTQQKRLVQQEGKKPTVHLLDLCTGSGCLLVTLALELQKAKWAENVHFTFVGTDLSEAALVVARHNQARLCPTADVKWFTGDLFAAFQQMDTRATFDLILSNPPYISKVDYLNLEKQVLAYEPRIALTDEADGYLLYRRILKDAPVYLTDGSYLAVEHGFDQQEMIVGLAAQETHWQLVAKRQDYGHRDRVLVWQYRFQGRDHLRRQYQFKE